MMQILKTLVMGLPKHYQACAPEGHTCPTFRGSLSHTNNCQHTHGNNTVSTNLSETLLLFKFRQIRKSGSYNRVLSLIFIINHS